MFQEINLAPHLEVAKGNAQQNKAYCEKDGEFTEIGNLPQKQGTRTDLAQLSEMVKNGATDEEIADAMPNEYIKYYKAVDRLRTTYQNAEADRELKKRAAEATLKSWQETAVEALKAQDQRKILWIWDKKGNAGLYR